LGCFKGDATIAELLIRSKADVNARNKDEATPLHIAAAEGHADVADLLVKHGADVNAKNKYGAAPLHEAASNGHIEVAELLLRSGADLNARNGLGSTPLHVAAHNGNLEVVEFLVKKGADVNLRNMYGATPLHEAAFNGHANVVRLLLESGADPSIRNNNGKTALEIARERGHAEVAELIKKLTSLSILDVEFGDLFVDEWGRMNVRVRGTGKASLTVEGDIDCLNPGSVKLTAKSVIIEIPIKPKRKGELPIKIVIKTSEEEDSKIAWLKNRRENPEVPILRRAGRAWSEVLLEMRGKAELNTRALDSC